jgi:hypothetical protein
MHFEFERSMTEMWSFEKDRLWIGKVEKTLRETSLLKERVKFGGGTNERLEVKSKILQS